MTARNKQALTERLQAIREMASKGMADTDIAKELGITSRTVLRTRHRHGIPSKWRPLTAECGRPGAYNSGCRCDTCRAAHLERMTQCKASRVARRNIAVFEHGPSGYVNWGCRCPVCTRANAEKSQQRRDRQRARNGGHL